MRRLGLILSVAVLATFLISIATLSAAAQTKKSGDISLAPLPRLWGSQGTVTGAKPTEVERRAARLDLAEEENLPYYSQVVDNAQSERFYAPGWERGGTDSWAHGGGYVSAGASTADARFKLKVPTDGDYALYAWWPARADNSNAARFGVKSARGTKWTEVDQTRDGGAWVKLGNYAMRAGDDYVVRVSPEGGSGEVVADAVALVRGVTSAPPKGRAPAEGGPTNGTTATSFGENVYTASSTLRSDRRALVRYGRTHIGTPYYLSPPNPCRAYKKEDCSCFTQLVFRHFNKYLPDSPIKQYKYGRMIHHKSHLARGDLVFFKENGPNHPITHVAMYSGNGYVLHASAYYAYQKVVESKMRYITGYYGARRVHVSTS